MEDPPFMPAKGAHHVSYYPDKANQEGAKEKLLQRNAAARKKPRDKPRRHDGGDGEEIDEEQARVSASVGWSLKVMTTVAVALLFPFPALFHFLSSSSSAFSWVRLDALADMSGSKWNQPQRRALRGGEAA
eukprot:767365-Hanusia_phi.AAC.6